MMTANRFHLDRRAGKIMGVCAGLARSTGIDVVLVRVLVLVLALGVFHGVGILAYCVAGLLADDRPGDY